MVCPAFYFIMCKYMYNNNTLYLIAVCSVFYTHEEKYCIFRIILNYTFMLRHSFDIML